MRAHAGMGASARGACWRHMYGGITVWLDATGADTPQRGAYALAEVHIAAEAAAAAAADGGAVVLGAIERLIDADSQLVGKKSLYIRLGARGDWPNLAEPGDTIPDLGA